VMFRTCRKKPKLSCVLRMQWGGRNELPGKKAKEVTWRQTRAAGGEKHGK